MRSMMFARAAALAAGFGIASAASASVLLSGTSGSLSAEVEFSVVGDVMTVRLANTATADAMVPVDVLTGVFFAFTGGAHTFTPVMAVVPGGHAVLFGGTDPGGVVSGEWAYRGDLVGAPAGYAYGIGSAGYGLYGPGHVFPGGTNLQGPADPDGLQYGITSAGDNPLTGNTPVTGTNALIKSEVVFTFSGATGFDPSRIYDAFFQYGTGLNEPGFHSPTPGALALLGLGGLVATRRRRD